MNNIEKLAIEHGLRKYSGPQNEYIVSLKELEAFAQALQSSEPVSDILKIETVQAVLPNGVAVSNVYDAYQEGLKTQPSTVQSSEPVAVPFGYVMKPAFWEGLHRSTICQKKEGSYQIPVYTLPPSTISLEEHNKRIAELQATNKNLLDALKDAREVLEETDYRNCLARVNKVIADAEGVDG